MGIGGACALVAFLVSITHCWGHLRNKASRPIKKCTLTIVAMVPLYALNASFCLFDPRSRYRLAEILIVLREFYEPVVMVAFLQLILGCLGGPENVAKEFSKAMQRPQHPFCLRIIPTFFKPGLRFIVAILLGLVQFVIAMIAVTCASTLLWFRGIGAGLDEAVAKKYEVVLKAIKAISCSFAMYNLSVFYFELLRNPGLKGKFESVKPEMKFLCIKGVIMFTMLQDFACSFLTKVHVFDSIFLASPVGGGQPTDVSLSIQSFLLCVELLVFAVLHRLAYPAAEFDGISVPPRTAGPFAMMRDIKSLTWKARLQKQVLHTLSAKQVTEEDLLETFHSFDLDGSGTISVEEFRYTLQCASFKEEEIKRLIKHLDSSSGEISQADFKEAFLVRAPPPSEEA